MSRTPAQIGAANRRRGKDTEQKVAAFLAARGIGNGRRNLAGYRRDHGDYGPIDDATGDRWAIEIKGPVAQPTPGQIEAWADEAAREAENAGAVLWVLIVRRPGCTDVGRWWAHLPVWMLWDANRDHVGGRDVWGTLARVDLAVWAALITGAST